MLRIRMMVLVALGLAVLAASAAMAKPDLVVEDALVGGTVKSIAADKASFVVQSAQGTDVTIKVNADTKYKVDAADSTFAEVVKVGARVAATVNADGLATDVVVKEARKGANTR